VTVAAECPEPSDWGSPPVGARWATSAKRNKPGVRGAGWVCGGGANSREAGLARGSFSRRAVSTVVIERHISTNRCRKFSSYDLHQFASTGLSFGCYNSRCSQRTLGEQETEGTWKPRTPVVAAGFPKRLWSLHQ